MFMQLEVVTHFEKFVLMTMVATQAFNLSHYMMSVEKVDKLKTFC